MEVNILEKLVDYYHENRLSHAYLIETNNIDKCYEDLKIVIKKIFCSDQYSDKCTKCNLCNLINQNYLPSFFVIEPMGNVIRKEQVLELKRVFNSIPVYTKENIYVIKNAEKLNDSSANTMLKFIEEPEDHIIGFFITNNINNVISTIRSRCEIIKVQYEESELNASTLNSEENIEMLNVIKEYLYKIEVEKSNTIMYNKDVLLNKFGERCDIRKIFKMILIVYSELFNKLLNLDCNFQVWDFLDNIELESVIKRINLVTKFLDDIECNANIELLLDKFVIELGDING